MKEQESEIKYLTIGEKTVQLKVVDFEAIDANQVLKIDNMHIFLESITFPVLANRIQNLLTEAENQVKKLTLDSKILKDDLEAKEAELNIYYYKELKAEISSPTVIQIKGKIVSDAIYQAIQNKYRGKLREVIEAEKTRDYISSLYWSAKSKMDVLTAFAGKIPLDPSDILDQKITEFNSIRIRQTQ